MSLIYPLDRILMTCDLKSFPLASYPPLPSQVGQPPISLNQATRESFLAGLDPLGASVRQTDPQIQVQQVIGRWSFTVDVLGSSSPWLGQVIEATNYQTEHFFSALAYAALLPSVDYLYLFYPKLQQLLTLEIKSWSRAKFLQELELRTTWFLEEERSVQDLKQNLTLDHPLLGRHQRREEMVLTLKPTQIFLGASNRFTRYGANFLEQVRLQISGHMLDQGIIRFSDGSYNKTRFGPVFIHCPLNINLCRPDKYITNQLLGEIKAAVTVGASGLVVHLGNSLHMPLTEALQNMAHHLRTASIYATPSCPLLVETSAGESTDVCYHPDELLEFIQPLLTDSLAICLDTCHVFSAGYDPLWYLEKLGSLVRCIHFNDCQVRRNGRRDRHAAPGTGQIGGLKMTQVFQYALERGLPMIVE